VSSSGDGPTLRRVSSHNSSLAEDSAPLATEERWHNLLLGRGPWRGGSCREGEGEEEERGGEGGGEGRRTGAGEVRLDLAGGLLPGERCTQGVPRD